MKTTLSNNQEIEIVKNEERRFITVTVNGRKVITVSTSCTRESILEEIEFNGLKHIKEPSFMDYKKLEDCAQACKALTEEVIDAILAVKNQKEAESVKSEEKETATATTIDEVVEVAKGIAQERGLNISFMIRENIIEGGRNLKTSESYEFDFENQSVIYDKTRDKVASAIILEAIDKIKASDSPKSDLNQTVKYYNVTYDKKVGGAGNLVVKARNEIEALKNAANICFTGSNFRDPVVVEKQDTFADIHENGRCGRNRMN
jgi:hypothetical protein